MTTVLVSLAVFALAVIGLSVGVILKKRTPLKGSCGSAAAAFDAEGHARCDSCSCGAGQANLDGGSS